VFNVVPRAERLVYVVPSRKSLAMYIACFNTAYHAQSWTNASFLSLSPQIQSQVYNASLKSRLGSHVSLVLRDCVVYNDFKIRKNVA
jgi:hypothetical protein